MGSVLLIFLFFCFVLISFLCFVFLHPVSGVPNFVSVSVLSIHDFHFLYCLFVPSIYISCINIQGTEVSFVYIATHDVDYAEWAIYIE